VRDDFRNLGIGAADVRLGKQRSATSKLRSPSADHRQIRTDAHRCCDRLGFVGYRFGPGHRSRKANLDRDG
jgi:hypothetical protein